MKSSKNTIGLELHPKFVLMVIFAALLLIDLGCSEDKRGLQPEPSPTFIEKGSAGSFELTAVYDRIRSCPECGGIFIAQLKTSQDFSGIIKLQLEADPVLNATLDRAFLDTKSNVAEITIQPGLKAEIKNYEIILNAYHAGLTKSLRFVVEMYPYQQFDTSWVVTKRDEFMPWLEHEHPEFADVLDQEWFAYLTYPQIWVVEHWTFLSDEWELRICFHVMIPPYDWSMMRLRKRGESEPIFAARRESDGTIHEIPVSDYPIMFGY